MKKKGRNNVTLDELIHLITPKGRGIINCFTDILLSAYCLPDGNCVQATHY